MPIRYIVIIPVFRHSVLVADAIRSVLAQEAIYQTKLIVIDDECPHEETRECLGAFRLAYPDIVEVYRQKNTGLSGARNAGIEIALHKYPGAEGVYFLDADNILERWALTRAGEAATTYLDFDWFYPDVTIFGMRQLTDHRGPFDAVELMEHNYCEAGSYVRMRVFTSGVRFDENMRLGYEDWDFWLQAAGRGFRGGHLSDAGFRYRRRGESMLSNSDRDRPEILGYLRRKHKKTFSIQRMLALEARDRPRSLFVNIAKDTASEGLCAPDSDGVYPLGIEDVAARIADITESPFPGQIYMSTVELWHKLRQVKLANWVSWECERRQHDAHVIALRLVDAYPQKGVRISDEPFDISQSHLLHIKASLFLECANDPSGVWINSLGGPTPSPKVRFITLIVSGAQPESLEHVDVLRHSLFYIDKVRDIRGMYGSTDAWRQDEFARLGGRHQFNTAYDWHRLNRPFPYVPAGKQISIGFILPIAAFGGVERVCHQLAAAAKWHGLQPHLLVVGPNEASLTADLIDLYETIRFYRNVDSGEYGWRAGNPYIGTSLPYFPEEEIPDLAGLCADLDVVVNAHSGASNLVLATLRRSGKLTASSQHVFDLTPGGRSCGHPMLGLAFEHAYDVMLPVSQQMARQLHALGIPRDKIIPVPNAGGFVVDDADADEVLRNRSARSGPLRCLFMGRLDYQKGHDRLTDIIGRSATMQMNVEWRVVGKSVIDRPAHAEDICGVRIEEPVFEVDDVIALLSWADVIVSPSRYEGLPLLAHEAMAYGVVFISTDVGAVNEVVQHGETGYLFQQNDFVEKTVTLLAHLQSRPADFLKLGYSASAAARQSSWKENIRPFVDWIISRTHSQLLTN